MWDYLNYYLKILAPCLGPVISASNHTRAFFLVNFTELLTFFLDLDNTNIVLQSLYYMYVDEA